MAAETLSGPNDIDIEWWLSALNSRNAPLLKLIKLYACDH